MHDMMIMIDCLLLKNFKYPVTAVPVDLIFHKQSLTYFYSIVKSIRNKPNICISQTLIVCKQLNIKV